MKKFSQIQVIIISSLIIAALSSANRIISLNYKEWYEVYIIFITNLIFTVATWYCLIKTDKITIRFYRNNRKAWRYFTSSIIGLLFLFFIAIILFRYTNLSSIYFYGKEFSYSRFIPASFFRSFILVTAIQTIKYMLEVLGEKQNILLENEILKREKLYAQFQALKQQVDPHFLFNSLNTLKSLIKTNNINAEEFVIRLSEIYRYILQKNRNDLVTISEELSILNSYVFMLKSRFEDSININIYIENNIQDNLMLPPFTLQLLLENAIKHNVTSYTKPLNIQIFNRGDFWLIVKNNFQPKKNIEESTGIGLENINMRCKYLCGQGIEIIKTDSEFIVEIPLIKKHENSNH